jgi:hypothetical protein
MFMCTGRIFEIRLSIKLSGEGGFREEKKQSQSHDRIQNRSKTMAQEHKKIKSDQLKVGKEKAESNYATIVRNQYEWFERLADRIDANPKPRPAGAERP